MVYLFLKEFGIKFNELMDMPLSEFTAYLLSIREYNKLEEIKEKERGQR